jgi:hypothetical protein
MRWFVLWSIFCCGFSALFLLPRGADGQCASRRRVIVTRPVVVVAVKKVAVVTEVIPVAVYNPVTLLYGASYQPYASLPSYQTPLGTSSPTSGTPTSGISDTQAIIQLLQRMDARLTTLEQRTGIKPEPLPVSPKKDDTPEYIPKGVPEKKKDGLGILNLRCAKCHTEGSMAPEIKDAAGKVVRKGASLKIFNTSGDLNKLTIPQWLMVSTRTSLAEMPPPIRNDKGEDVSPMPDAENTELHRFIALQK